MNLRKLWHTERVMSARLLSPASVSPMATDQRRRLLDTPEVDDNRPPDFQHRRLRNRGRFSRASFGRGGAITPLLPSSTVYSSSEDGRPVTVVSVVDIITETPHTTTTDSATQTPRPMVTCTAEARTACEYIDKLVAAEETDGEIVPTDFLCPITHQAMKSPFAASDGFTYEHNAIQIWMRKSNESPISREVLRDDVLVRNRALEQLIIRWSRDHAKQYPKDSIHSTLTSV